MRVLRILMAPLLMLMCSGQSPSYREQLGGLRSAHVLVWGFDADARKCGIASEKEISNAFMLPVRAYTKLVEQDRNAPPFLYIMMEVAGNETLCIARVGIELFVWAPVTLPFRQGESMQKVVLYEESSLISSGRQTFAKKALGKLEQLGKQLSTDWQKANQ